MLAAALIALFAVLLFVLVLGILRWPILIALVILFTVSLDYWGSMLPGLVTANSLLKVLGITLLALRSMQTGTPLLVPRFMIAFLPFILMAGISVFYSSNFLVGAYYWSRLLFNWLFAVVIANAIEERKQLRYIAFGMLGVTILTSAGAILQSMQLFQSGPLAFHKGEQAVVQSIRVTGAFASPNKMAVYLVGLLIFQFAAFPDLAKNWGRKGLFLLSALVALIAILLSLSRSGYMAFALALALFLFSIRHRRLVVSIMGACVLLLVLILVFTPYQAHLVERFMSFTELENDSSGNVRYHLAASGLYMFADGLNAIWGTGLNSFNIEVENYLHYLSSHDSYYHVGIRASHNYWITIIAEMGLVGLFLFLVFLREIGRSLLRIFGTLPAGLARSFAMGLTIYFTVKLFDLNFNPSLLENSFWYALGLLGAIAAMAERGDFPSRKVATD